MIGSIVSNYKITNHLGEGGMGAVYKGVDLMLEREVAIKALRPELLSRPDLVERFRSEAVTLAKLNHPNIATLYNFFRQGDEFFMVLEFVPGETLEALVKRQGTLSSEFAASLMQQALAGIEHAHDAGIIHRDIKLANLMLAPNNVVKVMDFGIARALGNNRLTQAGRMVGTIEYMSPEQIRGHEADTRSDLYSLGIALYELVTGRLPFHSDSDYELMRAQIEDAPPAPRNVAAHVSPALEQIILRALAKDPNARFQSAAEFCAALAEIAPLAPAAEFAAGRKTPVPATRFSGDVAWTPQKSKSFNLNWKHAAGAAALVLAIVTSVVVMTGEKAQEPSQQINAAALATPSPEPTATPLLITTPSATTSVIPEPTPTAAVAIATENITAPTPVIAASTSPSPAPKPTVAAKAEKDKRPSNAAAQRAESIARQREIERKRKLADSILNQ